MIELEDFWQTFCEEFRKAAKKDKTNSKLQDFQKLFERLIVIALNRIEMSQAHLECLEKPPKKREHTDEDEDDEREDEIDNDLRELDDKIE